MASSDAEVGRKADTIMQQADKDGTRFLISVFCNQRTSQATALSLLTNLLS